jgi:hypothetical protein
MQLVLHERILSLHVVLFIGSSAFENIFRIGTGAFFGLFLETVRNDLIHLGFDVKVEFLADLVNSGW